MLASKQDFILKISVTNGMSSTIFCCFQNLKTHLAKYPCTGPMLNSRFWSCSSKTLGPVIVKWWKELFHHIVRRFSIFLWISTGAVFLRNNKRYISDVKQLWLEDTEEKCRAYIIRRVTPLIRISKHTVTFAMPFPHSSTCLNRREWENQRVKTLVKIYGRGI